ncbi:MAG: hypothetical protein WCD42_04270, partial [Rhizomicrobium sp.]
MFGKRTTSANPPPPLGLTPLAQPPSAPLPPLPGAAPEDAGVSKSAPPPFAATPQPMPRLPPVPAPPPAPNLTQDGLSDEYYKIKSMIFNALIETLDPGQLSQ